MREPTLQFSHPSRSVTTEVSDCWNRVVEWLEWFTLQFSQLPEASFVLKRRTFIVDRLAALRASVNLVQLVEHMPLFFSHQVIVGNIAVLLELGHQLRVEVERKRYIPLTVDDFAPE